MARDLVSAYLSGQAAELFPDYPGDLAARRRVLAAATARPVRADVAAAIAAQNARLAASPARDAHIAALARGGAAAVVTGQQVGLFLGPLYTIYKAASAVRLAQALAAEAGVPVVPVFWLQTEDHDLPEIAWCGCRGAAGGRFELRVPARPEERESIAARALPEAVQVCLKDLREAVATLPEAEAHLARLERHYRPGAGWSAAFAGVLAELFADEGLVIVDPRDPALAAAARPVHERALVDAEAIARVLGERAAALTAAGYAAPVHVRPGAPLAFFHPDGPDGPRYRLEPAAGGLFAEVGGTGTHTRAALLARLAEDPLAFSTSALLRPILQDTWLPTAAYVGGPGEIAYFAQLAPLYAHVDRPMPLIVHRARFTIVDARSRRLLDRFGWTVADAGRDPEALLAHRAGAAPAGDALAERLLGPFEAMLDGLAPNIAAAGPDLTRAIAKTRRSVARSVGKLAARYQRALVHRDEELVAAVHRLRDDLAPDGVPQERWYGLPAFAARHGDRALVERVLAAITDPWDPTPKELTP